MLSKSGLPRASAAAAAAVMSFTAVVAVAPQASADTGTVNQTGYAVAYVSGGLLRVVDCTWPNGSVVGGCSTLLSGPAVAPGTSPSITKVGARGYEVAYQGANHDLWIAGSLGGGDRGFPMMPTSSPAITSPVVGGYDVAFQDNNGQLWTVGSDSRWDTDWGLPMDHASSPSITNAGTTRFEVAYESSTDTLGETGAGSTAVWPADRMAPGTSPSIAQDPVSGGWDIAFQADCGFLNVVAAGNNVSPSSCAGWPMYPGSSPSLTNTPATSTNPGGGMEAGFNEFDGQLFGAGAQLDGPVIDPRSPNGIQIAPGSSPAVIATTLPAYLGAGTAPGFEMFYTDLSNTLRYVLGSAFTSTYLNPASPIGTIDPGTRSSVISFQ